MDFSKLNDSLYTLPTKQGNYQWWSKLLGYIPVSWNKKGWYLNGCILDNKTVRYWR